MINLDADALRALDRELDDELRCECACATFPDRHGPARCTRPAAFYVEVHMFAKCQHPQVKADPNVTADGDKACYLCRDCLESAVGVAQAQMSRLPARAVCPQWPAAAGCGRPMTEITDYIPVRRLL